MFCSSNAIIDFLCEYTCDVFFVRVLSTKWFVSVCMTQLMSHASPTGEEISEMLSNNMILRTRTRTHTHTYTGTQSTCTLSIHTPICCPSYSNVHKWASADIVTLPVHTDQLPWHMPSKCKVLAHCLLTPSASSSVGEIVNSHSHTPIPHLGKYDLNDHHV